MVDAERASEIKQAQTKEERAMLRKGDTAYSKFLIDETQDADMEKLMDKIIDDGMKAGKSDADILAELGKVTGVAPGALSEEQKIEHQ